MNEVKLNKEEIDAVNEVIINVLDDNYTKKAIKPFHNFEEDYLFDELDFLYVVEGVEDKFNIQLSIDDVGNMATVKDIYLIVQNHI